MLGSLIRRWWAGHTPHPGAATYRAYTTKFDRAISGDEIPLISRIIAVADAYNAMTSERPYRDAMPTGVARQRLLQAGQPHQRHGRLALDHQRTRVNSTNLKWAFQLIA